MSLIRTFVESNHYTQLSRLRNDSLIAEELIGGRYITILVGARLQPYSNLLLRPLFTK